MVMTYLLSSDLSQISGGQQATPPSEESIDDRIDRAVRQQLDMREREDLRDYERNHRFTSFLCQGDRQCLRRARGG